MEGDSLAHGMAISTAANFSWSSARYAPMKFSTRDLLLVTVIVALAVGWSVKSTAT